MPEQHWHPTDSRLQRTAARPFIGGSCSRGRGTSLDGRASNFGADSFELTFHDSDHRPAARARALMRRAAPLPAAARALRSGGDFVTSYVRQLERLVHAVDGGGAPAATWADGLQAARIVDAAAGASLR